MDLKKKNVQLYAVLLMLMAVGVILLVIGYSKSNKKSEDNKKQLWISIGWVLTIFSLLFFGYQFFVKTKIPTASRIAGLRVGKKNSTKKSPRSSSASELLFSVEQDSPFRSPTPTSRTKNNKKVSPTTKRKSRSSSASEILFSVESNPSSKPLSPNRVQDFLKSFSKDGEGDFVYNVEQIRQDIPELGWKKGSNYFINPGKKAFNQKSKRFQTLNDEVLRNIFRVSKVTRIP